MSEKNFNQYQAATEGFRALLHKLLQHESKITPMLDASEKKELQPRWVIEKPGTMRLEGSVFRIKQELPGAAYEIYIRGDKIGFSHSLKNAQTGIIEMLDDAEKMGHEIWL